jgi:hypothetical protein
MNAGLDKLCSDQVPRIQIVSQCFLRVVVTEPSRAGQAVTEVLRDPGTAGLESSEEDVHAYQNRCEWL